MLLGGLGALGSPTWSPAWSHEELCKVDIGSRARSAGAIKGEGHSGRWAADAIVGSMGAGRVAKWDRDSTPRIENHMEHGKKIIEYVHIYI